jgi:hypothetical protein
LFIYNILNSLLKSVNYCMWDKSLW